MTCKYILKGRVHNSIESISKILPNALRCGTMIFLFNLKTWGGKGSMVTGNPTELKMIIETRMITGENVHLRCIQTLPVVGLFTIDTNINSLEKKKLRFMSHVTMFQTSLIIIRRLESVNILIGSAESRVLKL